MSDGIWSVFETIESTAILDRMEGGGLYVGEAGLMGIRGSSWTQATWMLGDLDITDPDRTGTPLFLADPEELSSIEITSGLAPADSRGAGPTVDLALRRPGDAWRKSFAANDAPAVLQQAYQRHGAPAIAHIDSFASAHFRMDGPLIKDRLGLFVSGTLTEGARAERADPRSLGGHDSDVLTHLVFTPNARDEVRFMGAIQSLVHPYVGRARFGNGEVEESDRSLQAQGTWLRQGLRPWSLTAGFVRGSFDPRLPDLADGVVERLADGPIQQQFPGASTRGRWAASGWLDPWTTGHHAVRVGTSLARTYSTTRPAGSPGLTPETVGGFPARIWDYGWAGPESQWRGFEGNVYGSDQVHYGRLSIDAGLRYEWSHGTAAGASQGIEWKGLSPRVLGRLRPFASDHLVLLAGIARYRYRLPLNLLAYGDPAAPQGNVYRWLDHNGDGQFQAGEQGPLIARVGPGGAYATIDPNLKAPTSREVFVGFETSALGWRLRGLAYHRREKDLVTSVNVGAPLSAYTVSYINDPGDDIVGTEDDQLLPIYNRRPETFGQDRYLLTNDPQKGTGKGLELSLDGHIGKNIHLIAGGTASKTLSLAPYGGFLATENDQGLVGDRLELPNAETLSTGRLFFERGYTLKIAGTYVAPFDFHIGLVARYQDGQHFARFVIPTDLNQGPEPIKATVNGDSRFTYVLTIDAKIEKGFAVHRGARLAAVLEAFNLRGTGIEVEENVTWGPYYRETSAVQPPRSLRLGMRLDW
ncbi:MAG TPA: TonB-dependent receptor [Vicinamibacteria bacterium]|nr:TonB-dependent receptor [Vicinamibacteria bacterium]